MVLPRDTTGGTERGTPPPKKKRKKKTPATKGGDGLPVGSVLDVGSEALNPKFDARMRRVGSPDQHGFDMKRGWIQVSKLQHKKWATGTKKNKVDPNNLVPSGRVNFLFNPSQVTVSHAIDPSTPNPAQRSKLDEGTFQLYGTQSSVAVELLYDRTYEMFSQGPSTIKNAAHYWGMYADVAAWYKFLLMIDTVPHAVTDITERVGGKVIKSAPIPLAKSIIKQPLNMVMAYLYFGPRMIFFGYVNNLEIVYSHWSQHMIPIRGSVTINFTIIPEPNDIVKTNTTPGIPVTLPGPGDRPGEARSRGDDWNN